MDSTIMNPNIISPEILQNEEKAEQYSNDLVHRINSVSTSVEAHPIVDEIQVLYEAFPNNEIVAQNYVECLRVLVCRQTDEADYSKSSPFVSRISNLYNRFPSNEMIALFYMNCLLCLTFGCKAYDEIALLINKMQLLYNAFPNLYDMNKFYIMGLYRLSDFQSDPEELQHTTEAIRQIYEKVPDDEFFAKYYACSLVNLTENQDDSESTVAQLRNLHNRFSDNVDIAQYYANGLANLVIEQCEPSIKENTIEHLENLYNRFKDQYIAELFGKSLVSLSKKQKTYIEIGSTVDRLKQLYLSFPQDEKIVSKYATGLANLIDEQCLTITFREHIKTAKDIERREKNSPSHPKDMDSAFSLLLDVVALQQAEDLLKKNPALETIKLPTKRQIRHIGKQLQQLHKIYPQYIGVTEEYARCLVSLSDMKQSSGKKRKLIKKIEMLYEQNKQNKTIASLFAKGLGILFKGCSNANRKFAVLGKLRDLQSNFPKHIDIAKQYAECISDLIGKGTGEMLAGLLKNLHNDFPTNEDIAEWYAKSLDQWREDSGYKNADTVDILSELHNRFPDNDIIDHFWSINKP